MKKILIHFIVFIVLAINKICAQGNLIEDFNIARKTTVSNNYNTGKVGISIPLYNIDLGKFTLQSNLSYKQEIPKGEPSLVGTNWDLNLFGKIVIGYKDPSQFLSPFVILNGAPNGYNLPQNVVGMPDITACIVSPELVSSKYNFMNSVTNNKSTNPNQIYFDFLDYNGYMIYDNTGKFIVNCEQGNLTAELYGDKCYNLYQPISNIPQIVMKDDEGNQFYFGGDFNTADIYYGHTYFTSEWYNSTSNNYSSYTHTNYLSALYLKKVVLANGRIIEAFYKQGNRNILDPYVNGGIYMNADYPSTIPSKTTLLNNNLFLGVDEAKQFDYSSASNTWYGNVNVVNYKTNRATIYQKTAVLDSLRISDYGSISFDYIQLTNGLSKPFLKTLKVKSTKKEINNINFNYSTLNNTSYLESLVNNQNEYKFNYYTDFANTSPTNPSGLIKSITYPTRGFESFEYEQNKISKRLNINVDQYSSNETLTSDLNLVADGFRLKKIKKISSNGNYVKNFSYLGDDGKESGIYTNFSSSPSGGSSVSSSGEITTWAGTTYRGRFDDYIRYSIVTEEISGKERNKYYFTDLITNPDSIASKMPASSTSNFLPLKINKNIERGKLYKVEKYDSNNSLVFKQEIKYTNFLNSSNPISEIGSTCTDCKITDDRYYVATEKGYASWQYQPVLPYLPQTIKTFEKIGNDFIESKKYFKYNTSYLYWHPHIIEEKTELLNITNITNFYYPGDILRKNITCITGNCPSDTDLVGEKFSIYKEMLVNNINFPIITISSNNGGKTSLNENIYKKDYTSSNLIELEKTRVSLLGTNFTINNYNQAQVYDKDIFELYDNVGNILQLRKSDGIPETIIWGYKQNYPIAKIKGATYSQVVNAFGLDGSNPNSYLQLEIVKKSNLDIDAPSENNLRIELENFKNILSNTYDVTTYTYDPFVGVKSITPSSGIKESYIYDSFGKLERIQDTNNNIIKEYKYNYSPFTYYNSEKNDSFTKNNCASGMISDPIVYSVPANQFTSVISQADADQKAQDYMNVNGQNMANANGICYYPYCTFNAQASSSYIYIQYAPFQKVNSVVNAQIYFQITSNQGLNWSDFVQFGNIPAPCRPLTTITKTSGNWQITINQGSGQTVLRWLGSGNPSTGTTYNISFNYDLN